MKLDIDLNKRLAWLEKRIDCSYVEREYIKMQMKELVIEVVKKLTIPDVSKSVNCEHENEILHQGNGFVYKTCADCGEDI